MELNQGNQGTRVAAVLQRLGGACLGTLLATLLTASVEATWLRSAAQSVPWLGAWGASFCLTSALAGVLSVGVGALVVFFHGTVRPKAAQQQGSPGLTPAERAQLTASLLTVGPVLALAVLYTGKAALGVLSRSRDPLAGGGHLGLAAVLVFGVAALTIYAAGAALGRRYEARLQRPLLGAVVGTALGLCLLAMAIAVGNTGGQGGLLGLFGVFKRPELDLRGASLLTLIGVGGYLGAVTLPRPALTCLIGVPVFALYFGATSALEPPALALSLERYAPLSSKALGALRRLTDSDGDGFSPYFAHGDCDDSAAQRFPGAEETLDNGIDEDCSGADDTKGQAGSARVAADTTDASADASAEAWLAANLPKNLNVVLITVDTLRHDLSYTGYPRKVSPRLDELAARGTVFERAYSLASYTGKSLGPLLIGRYPSETHRKFLHFDEFLPESVFVQQRLQQAGIRTVSVQGHWYLGKKLGMDRGFDVLDMRAAPRVPQLEGDQTVNSQKISDAAIEQLNAPELADKQFFLWAHYLDPHAEYVPHAEYDFGGKGRERYDGEVAFTDHHIGRVIDAVTALGFASRTAIIVTSDHGEAFGEHNMYRHGFEVWEELVRVPLVVYVPGAKPQRVSNRRSAVDLAPTLLQLMGQPVPAAELSGKSWVTDIFAPPGHKAEDRFVLVDMPEGPYNQERQAFIERDMKLITSAGRPLGLYDLAQDPGEKNDLQADAKVAAPVLERFRAVRQSLQRVTAKK